MRVAVFHNLPSGGAKRSLLEWTRRLAIDHTVDVFTLSTADHAFCDLRPVVRQHDVFEWTPRRLFASPFGRLNQDPRWRDLRGLERVSEAIAHRINTGGYDILFANPCARTFIPALLQHVTIPSAYYLHEPVGPGFPPVIARPYLESSGLRRVADAIDPLIGLYRRRLTETQLTSLESVTVLLSNSAFTSQCMAAAHGVNPQVCPLGVDTGMFQPADASRREPYVLSVGELTPRKGFDFLVESLALVRADLRPTLKLACNTVRDDERDYVERLAKARDVRLDIVSHVDSGEMAQLHHRSLFCVYAPVMEPFGLVPLEAMACGRAVVGVREGGVAESVIDGETGLLVERSRERFARAVETLVSNPGQADAYGRQGREHVLRNWTWERSTRQLESLLRACVAESH